MEKFSKEQWFKLSKEEQDFYTFEFNKSVEKRKRLTILFTRIIALFFILALFYIGYIQFEAVKSYNQKIDEYGNLGYCYLCGEKALRRCECQYNYNVYGEANYTAVSNELANYNIQKCSKIDPKSLEVKLFNSSD